MQLLLRNVRLSAHSLHCVWLLLHHVHFSRLRLLLPYRSQLSAHSLRYMRLLLHLVQLSSHLLRYVRLLLRCARLSPSRVQALHQVRLSILLLLHVQFLQIHVLLSLLLFSQQDAPLPCYVTQHVQSLLLHVQFLQIHVLLSLLLFSQQDAPLPCCVQQHARS
jgi:hypothetical protein